MSKRIVLWGTGFVGKLVIAEVVKHPEFELVGVGVSNPEKVGRDVGEICALGQKLGLAATDDVDALNLEQLVKPFRSAMKPQHPGSGAIQVRHSKHLAADIPAPRPINQVMAPVQRLRHMRQRQADRADTFVIHPRNSSPAKLCKKNLKGLLDVIH